MLNACLWKHERVFVCLDSKMISDSENFHIMMYWSEASIFVQSVMIPSVLYDYGVMWYLKEDSGSSTICLIRQ